MNGTFGNIRDPLANTVTDHWGKQYKEKTPHIEKNVRKNVYLSNHRILILLKPGRHSQ